MNTGKHIRYPEKLVPSDVMQHAKRVDDIRQYIRYELIEGVHKDILQQYIYKNTLISLWFCRSVISWKNAHIKAFYTANLDGIYFPQKLDDKIFNYTHVLASPIKYLWKDLFKQSLDLFAMHWISSVHFSPLESTHSKFFYQKMIAAFPDRIYDAITFPNQEMLLLLKQ